MKWYVFSPVSLHSTANILLFHVFVINKGDRNCITVKIHKYSRMKLLNVS